MVVAIQTNKPTEKVELKRWEAGSGDEQRGDHDWEFATRKNETGQDKPNSDDSVVVAPIFYKTKRRGHSKNSRRRSINEPQIVFSLNFRPPLEGKPSKGLHWEVVGGLNKDQAASRTTPENSKKELKEETGLDLNNLLADKSFKGASSSAGMTDETHSISTALCKEPDNNHSPEKPDQVALKLVYIPLKDAFCFLKEQANKGYNVALTAIAATFNALCDLNVMPRFKRNSDKPLEVQEIWTADFAQVRTKFQEYGLKKLQELKKNISRRQT